MTSLNLQTGRETETTQLELVGEGFPNAEVTIRSASGELLASAG
jgi:hypothetical protein